MLAVFRYLKDCHVKEEIITVRGSEGTRLAKVIGRQILENLLRNLDSYLQMLQLS